MYANLVKEFFRGWVTFMHCVSEFVLAVSERLTLALLVGCSRDSWDGRGLIKRWLTLEWKMAATMPNEPAPTSEMIFTLSKCSAFSFSTQFVVIRIRPGLRPDHTVFELATSEGFTAGGIRRSPGDC